MLASRRTGCGWSHSRPNWLRPDEPSRGTVVLRPASFNTATERRLTRERILQHVQPTCVQKRLACSAGDRPVGARARGPVAWMARREETEAVEPLDTAIF